MMSPDGLLRSQKNGQVEAMTKRLMFLFGLLGLTAQGCSQPTQVAAVSPPLLPAGWSCAKGLSATRSNGATAIYTGANPRDPGFCLGTLNGMPNNGYLGILPGSGGTAEARSAIAKLVAGPPGTEVRFTGDYGEPWTMKVVDRNDYVVDGRSYTAIHYSYSTPHSGANEVWMGAHNRMFFRTSGPAATWQITGIRPS